MTMSFQEACDTVCAPGTRFEIQEVDVFGVPTKVFAGTPPNMRYLFAAAAARMPGRQARRSCWTGSKAVQRGRSPWPPLQPG